MPWRHARRVSKAMALHHQPALSGCSAFLVLRSSLVLPSSPLPLPCAGSGLSLESDEAVVRQRVDAAVARVREIVSDVEATG